jgi:hypothetical protein
MIALKSGECIIYAFVAAREVDQLIAEIETPGQCC